MRLTTIWSIRHMTLRERVRRTNEVAVRAAARRVPARFAYWVLIEHGGRHIGGSTRPDEVIPEVPFLTVLERAGKAAA